jgi:hypothetical protein
MPLVFDLFIMREEKKRQKLYSKSNTAKKVNKISLEAIIRKEILSSNALNKNGSLSKIDIKK